LAFKYIKVTFTDKPKDTGRTIWRWWKRLYHCSNCK